MNSRYKRHFLQAGAFAKQVRAYGRSLIQPGASYNDIIQKINTYTKSLGAVVAFPPQMALNEVAAHYLVEPGQDLILSNEIVKLDIGVCYEGAIGDCAVTVDLSGQNQKLIDAAEAALLNAEKSICIGMRVSEIGRIIDETISSYGFKAIKSLGGHGLGLFKVHTSPHIPNYDDGSKAIIKPGMTFAIEPFATTGCGFIYETDEPTIFSFIAPRLTKNDVAHQLLARIKTFNGLPFSMHDMMSSELTLTQVKQALAELIRVGAIAGYGPLIEEEHGLVAQAENSVLVDENGHVTITTR